MWFSAIKLAVSAGSKIYANKQKLRWLCQMHSLCMHLVWPKEKKLTKENLLEARQSDWKDEAVLIILSLPMVILAWAVVSDDPTAMDKGKTVF